MKSRASGVGSPLVGTLAVELPTPALLVDLDRLEANLSRWQGALDEAGVRFRPHVKTHKIPDIAVRQIELGACGIVAAKVSEAEVFVAAGIHDIVIAFPVLGTDKWERAARIAASGASLSVNIDNGVGARGLSAAATANGARIGVQLEVDTGLHRVGVAPGDVAQLASLARLVESLPGLDLEGVTTYRGAAFQHTAAMTLAEAGLDEGQALVQVAEELRREGIPVREVTAGSTPTGRAVATVPGVTEVRAGTYAFNDLMQLGLGAAGPDDLALSVLTTVVSRHGDHATVDGGSKTFAGDSPVTIAGVSGKAFARSVDGNIVIDRLSEEHGMISVGADTLAAGDKVSWYPSHVCTCVNLSDELYGVRAGRVERVWEVAARGRRV